VAGKEQDVAGKEQARRNREGRQRQRKEPLAEVKNRTDGQRDREREMVEEAANERSGHWVTVYGSPARV
jgi:hypothetical protein